MEQQYVQNQNDEMEIDLVKIACALLRKWKWIVLSTVACALLAVGGVAAFALVSASGATAATAATAAVPSYTASASMYYLNTYIDVAAQTSHSMENYLSGDLQAFAVSNTVLEGVIEDLGLETSYEELLEKISVSVKSNTHILTISVVDEDAQQAQEIAAAAQVRFCDYVAQVMEVAVPVLLEDVTVLESMDEVIVASDINAAKWALVGAVLGFVLSVGCILVCPLVFGFGKSIYVAMKDKA